MSRPNRLLRSHLTVAEHVTRGGRGVHTFGPPKSQAGQPTLALPEELTVMMAEHLKRRGCVYAKRPQRTHIP